MHDYPGLSIRELAEKLNWTTVNGEPDRSGVHRMLKDLTKLKLTALGRSKKYYELTDNGEKVASQTKK
jgi:DNA-binding IclR family transcriptional regulator